MFTYNAPREQPEFCCETAAFAGEDEAPHDFFECLEAQDEAAGEAAAEARWESRMGR